MNNRILIILAHPRYERSVVNKVLTEAIPVSDSVTVHDLYQLYPDFNIDTEAEKRLLLENDVVIFQHPFYWYSSPPLLKQWIDMVLEFGWAYGPGGTMLKGKLLVSAITTGGQRHTYSRDGHNRFTINELLAPFDQTAYLCKMSYLPPFAINGTHKITPPELKENAELYREIITSLNAGDYSLDDIFRFGCLNDWIREKKKI
jgi:glutathione-regulated potassium-efflux system ancillary protein KefG